MHWPQNGLRSCWQLIPLSDCSRAPRGWLKPPTLSLQAAVGWQGPQDVISVRYATPPFLPSHFDWLQTQKTTEELCAPETDQVPCRTSSPLSCKNLCRATFHLPEDAIKVHKRQFKPALLLVKGTWQWNLELEMEKRRGRGNSAEGLNDL